MAGALVISVNRGAAADLVVRHEPERTGIDKRPAAGPVRVSRDGLDGDVSVDRVNHGGDDQAVYAYAREDLDWWAAQLGYELRDGMFGENITTAGLDITGSVIGETWQLGEVVVQVTAPRMPCVTFQAWMGQERWVRRFARAQRPGAYLRVLREGVVQAGDPARMLSRPALPVTLPEAMRAYYGDADIMRRVLEVEGHSTRWDEFAVKVLRRASA
jgi:MOSC domain-containing protein YiiM